MKFAFIQKQLKSRVADLKYLLDVPICGLQVTPQEK